jgi:hypothetical protein
MHIYKSNYLNLSKIMYLHLDDGHEVQSSVDHKGRVDPTVDLIYTLYMNMNNYTNTYLFDYTNQKYLNLSKIKYLHLDDGYKVEGCADHKGRIDSTVDLMCIYIHVYMNL